MRIETKPLDAPKYHVRCACGYAVDLDARSLEHAIELAEARHKCAGRLEVRE